MAVGDTGAGYWLNLVGSCGFFLYPHPRVVPSRAQGQVDVSCLYREGPAGSMGLGGAGWD